MELAGKQFNHYRVLELIGKGRLGEVYLAEETQTQRQVALKVIQMEPLWPEKKAANQALRLFEREMDIVSRLHHANIQPMSEHGEKTLENSRFLYLISPYRPERSLLTWQKTLAQNEPGRQLSPRQATHFIRQASAALQYAHDHQVMHLGIRPVNFLMRRRSMIDEYPDLFITDFGLTDLAETTTRPPSPEALAYLAPEQLDQKPVFASDQYALAIVAYELLTGRTPFQGTAEEIKDGHLNQKPTSLLEHIPLFDQEIDLVFQRALAKTPSERFSTVTTFAQAFQAALHNAPSTTKIQAVHVASPRGAATPLTPAPAGAERSAPGAAKPRSLPSRPPSPSHPAGSGPASSLDIRSQPAGPSRPVSNTPAPRRIEETETIALNTAPPASDAPGTALPDMHTQALGTPGPSAKPPVNPPRARLEDAETLALHTVPDPDATVLALPDIRAQAARMASEAAAKPPVNPPRARLEDAETLALHTVPDPDATVLALPDIRNQAARMASRALPSGNGQIARDRNAPDHAPRNSGNVPPTPGSFNDNPGPRRSRATALVMILLLLVASGISAYSVIGNWGHLFGGQVAPIGAGQGNITNQQGITISTSQQTATAHAGVKTAVANQATATAIANKSTATSVQATATYNTDMGYPQVPPPPPPTSSSNPAPGTAWHAQRSHSSASFTSVIWATTQFVTIGTHGDIRTSPDGINWTSRPSGTTQDLSSVAASDGSATLVAVGTGGTILTSTNGQKWTARKSGTTQDLWSVIWSDSYIFIAVGAGGTILTSTDGIKWTPEISNSGQILDGTAWSTSLRQNVVVGDHGTILTSPDGQTWTAQSSGSSQLLESATFANKEFVVVGDNGTILTSANSLDWISQSSNTTQNLVGIVWTTTQYAITGDNGTILTSPNGASWVSRKSGTTMSLSSIAWSPTLFVAVGKNGTILTSP